MKPIGSSSATPHSKIGAGWRRLILQLRRLKSSVSYQFMSPDRSRSDRCRSPRLATNVINESRQYRNTDLGSSSPATPFGYCRF